MNNRKMLYYDRIDISEGIDSKVMIFVITGSF